MVGAVGWFRRVHRTALKIAPYCWVWKHTPHTGKKRNTMLSSSSLPISSPPLPSVLSEGVTNSKRRLRPQQRPPCAFTNTPFSPSRLLDVTIPLAASVSILLWSSPVNAGILSGSSGLESMPGPQLPQLDFLNKWNDENQKKYAEFDSRFKSSALLKDYLERSKASKERNQRELQDKYCLRGAEWGVGDCSTEGMTEEERDAFIAMLKKRTGGE